MTYKSVEFKKYKLTDICYTPDYFDTDIDGHGVLNLIDMYGQLYPNGLDKKPIWFIRHCNQDKTRFGAIHEPGDNYLSVQTPLHLDDIAQKDSKIIKYRKINEKCYGIDSKEPFFEYRFYEDYLTYKEGNILDLKAELFPSAVFKHADDVTITSQITQPCLYTGTYEGKPVKGIGNFELVFFPKEDKRNLNDFAAYIYANDVGVRKDGRKEVSMVYFSLDGKSNAFYWLEGENPIISKEVRMEAEWEELPYVKDGTCIYKNATFYFGGKEIHFEGKWGAKGLTAYPRIELSGQSQVFGTWYEGNEPYKHEISMTFHENMRVFPKELRKGGFTVR